MLEVTLLNEVTDELEVELKVVRTGTTYNVHVPKYVGMTNEQLIARFRSRMVMEYMKNPIPSLFQRQVDSANARATRVKTKRTDGLIPNHLGETV